MTMKRFIILVISFLGICLASYAQSPIYLAKTYKPTEQKGYEVKTSIGIQGGETWKNAFTLWDEGKVSFNIGGKYEQLTFIM